MQAPLRLQALVTGTLTLKLYLSHLCQGHHGRLTSYSYQKSIPESRFYLADHRDGGQVREAEEDRVGQDH